jgi:hypothetical protein
VYLIYHHGAVEMAGRPPEVDHVKKTFFDEVQAAEDLVTKILQFKGGINPAGVAGIHPKHVRQVVELAFMGVVASWEEFLEMALVRYVAGAKTGTGYRPIPKFGRATSIAHAYQVLSNNPKFNPAKDYLKVSDPNWVTSQADFLFSTHGFGDVKDKAALLGHASSIRNRVAHSSQKCRADFKATAIHFLMPQTGSLKQGYGAGDLLVAPVQRHFGQSVVQSASSHFTAFTKLYKSLANKIVP